MIYADYNGSAPLNEEVVRHLKERIEDGPFANPNAIHCLGGKILAGMEKCRELCAEALGAKANQLIFNSGASEGISNIFYSVLDPLLQQNQQTQQSQQKNTIIISSIEHSAVVNAAKSYESKGFTLKILPVSSDGVIKLNVFEEWLKTLQSQVALVSIMAANNETGVIQPFEKVGELCQKYSIPYFSDTTQYIGKTDFNFQELPLDYAVCSGHKIGALTGTGILLAKKPRSLKPIIYGGGQEKGLRGGTQNYIGNETMAIALSYFRDHKEKLEGVKKAREDFEKNIKENFPNVVIFGEKANRLPGTTLLAYPGLHGQAIQIELESHDIFVTTSSACSDNDPTPSKVIKAMEFPDDIGRGVVRVSFGLDNSEKYYPVVLKGLCAAYEKLTKVGSFAKS